MLRQEGKTGTVMPVPRSLSSSCGTCVRFESDCCVFTDPYGELEQVVKVSEHGYAQVYRAQDGCFDAPARTGDGPAGADEQQMKKG